MANPPFQSPQAQPESGVRGNVPAPFGAGERLQSPTYRYLDGSNPVQLPGALESGNGAKFTPVDHTSLNVGLGSHQTPGTRCFDDPHSITKRVRDMRWAEGQ